MNEDLGGTYVNGEGNRDLAARRHEVVTHARRRIEGAVEHEPVDVLVLVSPENVQYAANVIIGTQRTIRDRLAIVVWPRDVEPTLIVCNIEESFCRQESWIRDIRSYAEHVQSPIAVLVDVLRERHRGSGRLAVEKGYLSTRYWEELVALLPHAHFSACEAILDRARMVKCAAELTILADASRATERALLATYLCVRPGDTERTLAQKLTANLLATGAESVPFLHMPAGANTGFAHPPSTDYPVMAGDLIKADYGGVFGGYLSDRARTMVVGRSSDEQRSMYERLVLTHTATIDKVRAGVRASDLYREARELYRKHGIPFDPPHAGHSIGIAVHEVPMLNATFDTELVPGMVVAIETRIRKPGEFGMHIEDLVEVTAVAPRLHSDAYPYDRLLVV